VAVNYKLINFQILLSFCVRMTDYSAIVFQTYSKIINVSAHICLITFFWQNYSKLNFNGWKFDWVGPLTWNFTPAQNYACLM